ncbi:MAG: Gfo/Idh/MocA family oxidoreductase [Verrucomicrobia bacterium]|nr:Gfo/Idh/MocA family oxidoreductase [Verrucomicrobiota bacterium]
MKSSSPTSKVNVAVVGLGFMGVTHLKAYQQIKGARIVAVCDAVRAPVNGILPGVDGNISGSGALDLGRKLRVYQQLDALLADPEVDLVDLCVPTPLHVPLAVAALKAGKHVVCEKPLARTAAEARKLVNTARAAKGFLLPAMCIRFWPEWAWLKAAADEGRYGKLLAARFRRVSETPGWSRDSYFNGAQSGGALLDLHIHDTDFVQFLCGLPVSVFSSGISRFSGAIDHVVTQYQVPGGAVVSAEGTWLMTGGHGFNMCYTANFEKATVDYDLSRGADALKLFEDGRKPRVIRCKGPDGYTGELRHMIESIQTGKAPTLVTPEDALNAVRICEAEEKSIKTGRPVKL